MKPLYFISLLCLFLIGCKEEDKVNKEWQDSEFALTFGEASEFSLTRGTPVTAFKDGDSFGVLAYNYPNTDAITAHTPNLFYDQEITNNAGIWTYSPLNYWHPDTTRVNDFFAFYPHTSDYSGITLSSNTTTGYPSFDYTVSSDITNQPDLMVASKLNAPSGTAVDFDFKHALAKVSFSIKGNEDYRIDSINIQGIHNTATLDFDNSSVGYTWSNFNGNTDFGLKRGDELSNNGSNAGTSASITSNDGYLFMLPQDVSGKIIYLEIIDDCGKVNKHTLTLPSSHIWNAGEAYNYTVTINAPDDVDLTFETPTQAEIEDTSNSYMLHPNKHLTYYIPIDQRINRFWQEYSQETDLTPYLVGNKSGLQIDVEWYDNSLNNGGLKLSLIDDTDAEFISNRNTGKVTSAQEPSFITEKAKVALKIELDPSLNNSSNHGNVVVSIRRNCNILWSWHFWITDYDPDNGSLVHRYNDGIGGSGDKDIWATNYASKHIMDRNLGAISPDWNGHGGNTHSRGSLFYQFGRPTPVSTSSITTPTSAQDLKNSIQHPGEFLNNDTWASAISLGGIKEQLIWFDKLININSTKKSFFDPSPLGWQIPLLGTYSSWSLSNHKFSTLVKYNSTLKGANYTTISGDLAYFPEKGILAYPTGAPTYSGAYVYFPTMETSMKPYCAGGNVNSNFFNSSYGTSNFLHAFPIRPIQE